MHMRARVSVVPIADNGRVPVGALQLDGDAGEPSGEERQGRATAVLRLHVPHGSVVRAGDDGRNHADGVLPAVVYDDGAIGKSRANTVHGKWSPQINNTSDIPSTFHTRENVYGCSQCMA
jgi:hypothetical protein